MSEEGRYKCPYCGCQDQVGYIEPAYNQGVQWRKVDGVWKKVQPTVGTIVGFHYCPECGKMLPPDVVSKWLKEPREDYFFQLPQASQDEGRGNERGKGGRLGKTCLV
jgi:hypothetical protein